MMDIDQLQARNERDQVASNWNRAMFGLEKMSIPQLLRLAAERIEGQGSVDGLSALALQMAMQKVEAKVPA